MILIAALFASGLGVMTGQTGVPGSAEIHDHLRKAAEYLQARQPDSAAKEFQAVLALDPRNAEAYANLGAIAFFRQDYQNASRDLRKALEINPSLAKTEALLGICERRLGEPSAQSLLEKSFPRLKDKAAATQAGLELANIYYQQGELDRAGSIMRSLVDLDPDNVEILYMAQRVYSEWADDTLNKLAILAPGSARMQQVIAERLVNDGDLKRAAEHYRKALTIDPRLPGVHYELAEAIFESAPNDAQSQSEAEQELATAVKLEGASSKTECMLARIAVRRSDFDAAYTHYSHAFALSPGDVEAQIGLGRLLASREKPREAEKYLRMAAEADPLNSEAHYRLAAIYRSLQMTDEANKETRLFHEIKEAKAQVRELYRQMNRRTQLDEDQVSDLPQ